MMSHQSFLVLAAAVLASCERSPALSAPGGSPLPTARRDSEPPPPVTPAEAVEVVEFWKEAGPDLWFAKDPEFDRRFRERFLSRYEAAARGELSSFLETPDGALALCILLDQFPRSSFRGTPRMYETDALARSVADAAIRAGHDRALPHPLAVFLYLPFGHSENLADQERSVELARRLGEEFVTRAEHHRDIVRRFGRFPHRNTILGRPMREEEQRYLDEGGFKG